MLLIVNLQFSKLSENGIGDQYLLYTYISPIRLSGPIWTYREVSLYQSWTIPILRPIWSNKNRGIGDLFGNWKNHSTEFLSFQFRRLQGTSSAILYLWTDTNSFLHYWFRQNHFHFLGYFFFFDLFRKRRRKLSASLSSRIWSKIIDRERKKIGGKKTDPDEKKKNWSLTPS